jgi:hypothetical protein
VILAGTRLVAVAVAAVGWAALTSEERLILVEITGRRP